MNEIEPGLQRVNGNSCILIIYVFSHQDSCPDIFSVLLKCSRSQTVSYTRPFWILTLNLISDVKTCFDVCSLTYSHQRVMSTLLPRWVCSNQRNIKHAGGGGGEVQMYLHGWNTVRRWSDMSAARTLGICCNFTSERQSIITNGVCHISLVLYGFMTGSCGILIVIWYVDIFRVVKVALLL